MTRIQPLNALILRNFQKIEMVAVPEPGPPRRRLLLLGEWTVIVVDEPVAIGVETDGSKRRDHPAQIGDDHRQAPEEQDGEDERTEAAGAQGMVRGRGLLNHEAHIAAIAGLSKMARSKAFATPARRR